MKYTPVYDVSTNPPTLVNCLDESGNPTTLTNCTSALTTSECCTVCDDLKGLFINNSSITADVFVALIDDVNGCSRVTLANLLTSVIKATDDQDCTDKKKIGSIDIAGTLTEFFESITGFGTPVIDNTDPSSVIVTLPYTNEECTVQNVTFTIPIPSPVSTFDSIDLKFDANGDLVVEAVYTDDNGNTSTITDTTPVTLPPDYVEYTGNNTVPTTTPPSGVDTRVLANGDRYDWDGTQWILASTNCPDPMTRAALIALRNAGGLNPQCHYIITDPSVDGNLGVESILIHALDANTLSGCYIKTIHDNTAWVGSYDIDTNDVERVFDHLNRNEVVGNTTILTFPFGNNSVTENVVHHSTLTVTEGTVTRNNITGGSNVTVSAGNFINNTVKTDANVTSAGNTQRNTFGEQSNTTISSGDFRENKVGSDATVNSSTTGDVDNNHFDSLSVSNITGTSNVDTITTKQNANLTISGGSLSDTSIQEDAQVTIISGSNYENVFGASTIYTQVGTGYIRYSTIEGTTSWINGNTNINNVNSYVSTINTTGSAGTISNSTLHRVIGSSMQNVSSLTITDSTINNYSSFTINGAARLYFYRSSLTDYGRVLITAGSRIDASYTNVSNNSYIQSSVSGGFLTINNTTVTNSSYARNTTPNANSISNSRVEAQSNMRFDGTATGCRIYYSISSSGTSMYHTTGAVNNYMYYVHGTSASQIYTQTSTNVRMYYCNATSYSYLRAIGNATTTYMYYCNADARGYVQMLNNIGVSRMYAVNAEGQSIVELRGSTGNLYYSSFSAYFYAYVTRTAGTSSGLFGHGRRTAAITNTGGIAPFASGSAWSNI